MIVLIGFMGAGKSTVGRLVADRLGAAFIDADEVITARAGMSVGEIFEARGESMFRTLEREVIGEILSDDEGVVALGGGALAADEVRDQLRSHTVVHLDVSLQEALRRIRGTDRPMLRSIDPLDLYEQRADTYSTSASFAVQVDDRDPDEIADEVIARALSGRRSVAVVTASGRYEVIVGKDVLREAGAVLRPVPRRAVVLHQPSVELVAKEVADALSEAGSDTVLFEMPDGEAAKAPEVSERVWTFLAETGSNREDALVTVGGGAVSDLGGFAASTFMRGLRLMHIPTSLLGQVDAAIGGKTALNLPQGKNLIGTIHQPTAVVCDVGTLATLPIEELRSGCAEVLKYAFIADPGLAELVGSKVDQVLAADPPTMTDIVERCVSIKADVVGEDERDTGRRKILNYGHTFAHAFEHKSGFRMRHGDAVALGMVAAAHAAQGLGWLGDDEVGRHRDALVRVGLPTKASYVLDDLQAAWQRDKKTRDTPRFVLLRGMGNPEIDVEVPEGVLSTALARLAG